MTCTICSRRQLERQKKMSQFVPVHRSFLNESSARISRVQCGTETIVPEWRPTLVETSQSPALPAMMLPQSLLTLEFDVQMSIVIAGLVSLSIPFRLSVTTAFLCISAARNLFRPPYSNPGFPVAVLNAFRRRRCAGACRGCWAMIIQSSTSSKTRAESEDLQ